VQNEEAPISQIGQFSGDAPAVPETGSTFAPLFLSLAALWGELDSAPFSQPNETQDQRLRKHSELRRLVRQFGYATKQYHSQLHRFIGWSCPDNEFAHHTIARDDEKSVETVGKFELSRGNLVRMAIGQAIVI